MARVKKLEAIVSASKSGNGDSAAVGFTVSVSVDTTVDKLETVVYDNIFTNDGNDFNVRSGEFTCSKTGMYAFHLHASLTGQLTLTQNNNNVIHVSSDLPSNSALLHLNENDVIKVVAAEKSRLHGNKDGAVSTFSGAFLG